MIARAKKAFPGMFVSLLLAVPAVAHAESARGDAAPAPVVPSHGRGAVSKNDTRKPQAARRAGARKALLAAQRAPVIPVAVRGTLPDAASGSPVWSDGSGEWRQSGKASWYGGPRWHGKPTSGGQRYDEHALTAAHATLPMGSRVRVTVPESGRSVVVVINDRPGTRSRVIDLSRAAAAELGIVNRGVAMVSLAED
jgi:rare lipoprotein A (peptidoglycan hydrolase)